MECLLSIVHWRWICLVGALPSERVFGVGDFSGLSQCARSCARHVCTPTVNDKFICAATIGPVLDCQNSSSCEGIKLDFGGNGFVRYALIMSKVP